MMAGTPDVSGNGVPDIWAIMADGRTRLYYGASSAIGPYVEVMSLDYRGKQAMG